MQKLAKGVFFWFDFDLKYVIIKNDIYTGEIMENQALRIGIDVGSTTVKVVLTDECGRILYKKYIRHKSQPREVLLNILSEAKPFAGNSPLIAGMSGSASMGIAEGSGIDFIQEVFATRNAANRILGSIDVIVELGGEDAKILFLTGGSEERMNGSCAGGTGAFIDQMASLMDVTVDELDTLSTRSQTIYNIASRCGVFAKSDIQPLLNQGASKADIAISIYQAIVNQTIGGLAQGRPLKGKIAFLGGPLTFMKGLRQRFQETLKLDDEHAVFPENSEYFVALGAAISAEKSRFGNLEMLIGAIKNVENVRHSVEALPPLFQSTEEYDAFCARHNNASVEIRDVTNYEGNAYLGIDCGSTTTKLTLIGEDENILYTYYAANKGEPLKVTIEELKKIYAMCGGRITVACAAVTGYGEQHIRDVLQVDYGIVETVAHLYSAKHFNPDVDFIIDIGGQDIKCFKLKNGMIDSIMLNEACSSGCGSFISTFSEALGYPVEEFAKLGLFAERPVNLGSRCTVFMNSSVKQAQKDGATVEDISAGLSYSVVKNAIYKVIRASSKNELGKHIVCQGGTFLNDAVLRAFEKEMGTDVVRPNIAGLMGAYGAALYAKQMSVGKSGIVSAEKLEHFQYACTTAQCQGCTNRCKLIVTTFGDGKKCISGNRCEKMMPAGNKKPLPNAYDFKTEKLLTYRSDWQTRGKIGIPFGLNMYENLPFWHTLFSQLRFNVILSGTSSRELFTLGQHTIPSDTVCYPAKLMHGHIMRLIEKKVDFIFYPCLPYNFNEHTGDNHYNCPIVAYYPELIRNNMSELAPVKFYNPYFAPHEYKSFKKSMTRFLKNEFDVPEWEAHDAIKAAYRAYDEYKEALYAFGDEVMKARGNVIVLCGRPYHADPEINHGIDKLINSLGFAVISEDMIRPERNRVDVLNQWTYHSRLYNAAYFAVKHENVNVVQIVSFGCGLDAITTDEMRDILEKNGKIYTQIKIDEINNLGAAKIRLRSLAHVIENERIMKQRS